MVFKQLIFKSIAFVLTLIIVFGAMLQHTYIQASAMGKSQKSPPLFDTVQLSYINNANSGRYLRNSSNSLTAASGTLLNLSNTIKWQITPLEDGSYTIQSKTNLNLYLSGHTSSDTVYLNELTDTSIPNYYRWNIFAGTGGCIIQNVYTQKYLYDNGRIIASSSTLGTPGTTNYNMKIWRIVDSVSFYGRISGSFSYIELPQGFKFNTFYLFSGISSKPSYPSEYNNVLWASSENFTFTGYDEDYVTFDSITGYFTAAASTSLYSTTITATHKVTNRTCTFTLVINPRAVCIGITNNNHNHVSALNNINSSIISCGYSSAPVYSGAFSAESIINHLDTDENNIFISRSHGGIILNSNNAISGTRILLSNHEVDDPNGVFLESTNISLRNKDLSNMKLIMFIGCWTASGNSNLPSVAVNCGAKTAVGFTESIDCGDANNWTEDFFLLLASGVSVYSACNSLASQGTYSSTEMTSFDIYGHASTRIK